jgi:RimJ/RimL family protein N-acetyltransferase
MEAPRSERLAAELPDPDRHLEFAVRQLNHPRVAPLHGGGLTREETRQMLEAQAEQARSDGFCLWWWRERASRQLVGYVGLNQAEVEGEPVVEVGWSIRPDRWGEGLASEAAAASLDWGLDRVGLGEIVSFALTENARSRAVMERIGMRRVRGFDRRRLPHVLYRVSRTASPGQPD